MVITILVLVFAMIVEYDLWQHMCICLFILKYLLFKLMLIECLVLECRKMAATDMGINNLPDSVGTSHPLFKQLNPHSAFFSGGIRQWILQISLDSAMNAADFLLILQ